MHLGLRPQCFVYVLYTTYIHVLIWRALEMKMVKVAPYVFKVVKRLGKENTIELILGINIIILC
jgi:hypothetical protein